MEKITIVQQNLCAYKTKSKFFKQSSKEKHKKYDKYIRDLIDKLLDKNPDILMLSEFCYNNHKDTVIDLLESKGYEIIYPKGYRILYGIYGKKIENEECKDDDRRIIGGEYLTRDNKYFSKELFKNFCDDEESLEKTLESDNENLIDLTKKLYYGDKLKESDKRKLRDLLIILSENNRKREVSDHRIDWTVCILAVKKERKGIRLQFESESCPNLAKNDLRYIKGTLTITAAETQEKKNKPIKIFFAHIPLGGRKEYKRQMLRAAYAFCSKNASSHAFIGGDFNSDVKEKTALWFIFKKIHDEIFEDTEPKEENTYKDAKGKEKRFDYALASKPLVRDCKCRTEPPIDTISECGTDHKALFTTIEI